MTADHIRQAAEVAYRCDMAFKDAQTLDLQSHIKEQILEVSGDACLLAGEVLGRLISRYLREISKERT